MSRRSSRTSNQRDRGRTKTGVALTDAVLERMADEAHAGLDLKKLKRRPGRPAMGSGPADAMPVRLDPEMRKAVHERAAADHMTASDVVRAAIREYLQAD